MKFAADQTASKPNWFFINFSTTGGIGKFFRIEDLSFFSAYVQVFYQYMPIDWLIELYLAGRVCGIDKDSVRYCLFIFISRPLNPLGFSALVESGLR